MKKGFSLVSTLVAIILSVVVIGSGTIALHFFVTVNNQVKHKDDLLALRAEAISRIDCERTRAASCALRDKNGNPWPNTTGTWGRWLVSSSCQSSGILINRRLASAVENAQTEASLDYAATDTTTWQPLFEDKPLICENASITSTPTSPLPYYQIATAVVGGVYGCHYSDGGANASKGYSISGTAVCPLGYMAVGGGNDCGTNMAANTTNLPYGGGYLWASGGYYGWQTGVCAKSKSSCTYYAVCIRN